MINFSICLSDLPKEKITTSKNGKKYISLVMWENKEADKFGNTHSITISKSKEEKDNPTVYVGNGKDFKKVEQKVDNVSGTDDLPF